MNFVKYLTAFSMFSVVAGITLPTNAITFNDSITRDFEDVNGNSVGQGTVSYTLDAQDSDGDNLLDRNSNEFNSLTLTSTNFSNSEYNFSLNTTNPNQLLAGAADFNFQTEQAALGLANASGSQINFDNLNQPKSATVITDINNSGIAPDQPNEAVNAQVPFEAEGTMGLVALGGYLFYRNRKKRKQALNQ